MANAARTLRIFVSSTFSDLKEERNALQAYVFPRLRELCAQHGCRFQAIDLRWGVRDEAGLDQQTMKMCLEGHSDAVFAFALSPDETLAVTASADATLKVWDLGTGKSVATLTGHDAAVQMCAFSPDGSRIVSASNDGSLKIWDFAGEGLAVAPPHHRAGPVHACAFSPDGKEAVTGRQMPR